MATSNGRAVLVLSIQPILAALDDALAGDDPGAGLEAFLLAVLSQQATHRALAEELSWRGWHLVVDGRFCLSTKRMVRHQGLEPRTR